jgi:glutamate synthase domain-containing protein 2
MCALGYVHALRCNRNTCPTGVTTHKPRLQKGLVVAEKDRRVADYAACVMGEVEMIAHSVGVAERRQLDRRHVWLVQPNGRSLRMNELYPQAG